MSTIDCGRCRGRGTGILGFGTCQDCLGRGHVEKETISLQEILLDALSKRLNTPLQVLHGGGLHPAEKVRLQQYLKDKCREVGVECPDLLFGMTSDGNLMVGLKGEFDE